MEAKAESLFEVSWEVCKKVGGIYTVVMSKALPVMKYYDGKYFTVGPYFPGKVRQDDFIEKVPPAGFKTIFDNLRNEGIICHFGTWNVEGDPNAILVDYSGFAARTNDIKKEFWEKYRIDSLNTQFHDYDEPIVWSYAVGMLLERVKNEFKWKIVAQFHEWLAGGALLYLKARNVKIGTVFTTHATMLGRTLATNNVDLYGLMDKLNPEEEAYKYGIQAKFLTEKACAHNSDSFTTVSEITGIEATHFLGKKPDFLLPNGLDRENFPTFDDASVKHKLLKAKIKRFIMYYFFPYYTFNLDETLIYFLAGRYEFQNKGIDVFIKSLAKLNEDMKKSKSEKTVVSFIWVPTAVNEIRIDILENKTFYEDVSDSIHDEIEEIKDRIIYGMISKADINDDFVLGKALKKELQRRIAKFSRDGLPPLCTHHLPAGDNDEIIKNLKLNGLMNREEDRVKVIFYPIYLTGADQLTDLSYYEALMASHLGVFPSYYEPWGYTPMETGALGIASVTTDLAGFGRYVQKIRLGTKNPGIYVLERLNKSEDEIVDSLYKILIEFATLAKQDRIENKLKAKRLADTADWNLLIENYLNAHNMAADKNS